MKKDKKLSVGFSEKYHEIKRLDPFLKIKELRESWERLHDLEKKAFQEYQQYDTHAEYEKLNTRIKEELKPLVSSIYDELKLMTFWD